jgi:hypothetical protein
MFSKYVSCNFEDSTKTELEPRLVEYLKKRKFNKENGINDDLLEKTYSIDKKDVNTIKSHFINAKLTKSDYTDFVDTRGQTFSSMSEPKDKRLDKIKEKQRRDKEANDQRTNYDIVARKYDMYRDDRKFASAGGSDFKSRFNPNVWLDGQNVEEIESEEVNPNVAQVVDMRQRFSSTNVYKNEKPKIRYQDYMTRGCNQDLAKNKSNEDYSLDSIIGKLDSYTHDINRTYEKKSEMDLNSKSVIPSINCNNKRDIENNYQTVPLMNGEMRDVNTENYLAYGSGQVRAKKSRGYPNPVENYFSYISDDIQKPEHVVSERGMPSRLFNKDTPKKYKARDIL